jgi:hypothetical protein
VFARGSSVHQRCSNYALTNLLFGLCKFVRIIDPLIIHPNPHPGAPTRPSTLEMLQAKERTPIHYPSIGFTFGFAFEYIKEFGGASIRTFKLLYLKKYHKPKAQLTKPQT